MTFKDIHAHYDELVHSSSQKLSSVHAAGDTEAMGKALLEFVLLNDRAVQIRETLFAHEHGPEFIAVFKDENDPRILATTALIESWKE